MDDFLEPIDHSGPIVKFLANLDSMTWEIFDREIDAIRWQTRHPGSRVEALIL